MYIKTCTCESGEWEAQVLSRVQSLGEKGRVPKLIAYADYTDTESMESHSNVLAERHVIIMSIVVGQPLS